MVANEQVAHLMVSDTAAQGPLQYQGHSLTAAYRDESVRLKPLLKKAMPLCLGIIAAGNSSQSLYVRARTDC